MARSARRPGRQAQITRLLVVALALGDLGVPRGWTVWGALIVTGATGMHYLGGPGGGPPASLEEDGDPDRGLVEREQRDRLERGRDRVDDGQRDGERHR